MKNRSNSRADILDECLRSIQEGKATLEDCLRAHPDAGPELRILLDTAVTTWNLMAPTGPSPEYLKTSEARLRRRLQAAQDTASPREATRPQFVSWRILRAAVVVLVMAVLLGSGWSVFSASAQAIPGDALYPAKPEFEQVRLALSWTAAGDVSLLAQYSDRRLEEIQLLVNKNRDRDLLEGIKQYAETIGLLNAALERLPQTSDVNQLQAIDVQLSVHLSILEQIRSLVPPSAQEALNRVIDRSRQCQGLIESLQQGKGPINNPPGQVKKTTNTSTATNVPTATNIPTATSGPTVTNLRTVTNAPTAANSPTVTNTPTATKEPKKTKDAKETKEAKDTKETKKTKKTKETKEAKDTKEPKKTKEAK